MERSLLYKQLDSPCYDVQMSSRADIEAFIRNHNIDKPSTWTFQWRCWKLSNSTVTEVELNWADEMMLRHPLQRRFSGRHRLSSMATPESVRALGVGQGPPPSGPPPGSAGGRRWSVLCGPQPSIGPHPPPPNVWSVDGHAGPAVDSLYSCRVQAEG